MIREERVEDRKDEIQAREREEKINKEGEKGRWMIGYPSHPRPRSTNIRVERERERWVILLQIVWRWEGARRGGFVSIKGIEVLSYSTSTLSLLPQQRPTCISHLHLLAALYTIPFSKGPLMLVRARSFSLKRSPDWKTDLSSATSFPVSSHPLANTRVLCFLLSRHNLVKHTEFLLMVTFSSHDFSISLFVAHELVKCYTIYAAKVASSRIPRIKWKLQLYFRLIYLTFFQELNHT